MLAPIRINTKLKEAPSKQKSIFEYAPSSGAAADYSALVEQVISLAEGRREDAGEASALPNAFLGVA